MAINLNDLQELLSQAQASMVNEKEVRKSLIRVENLVNNITKELTSIYELLDGVASTKKQPKTQALRESTEVDPEAPFGRRKDGTPKDKPGRSKLKNVVA